MLPIVPELELVPIFRKRNMEENGGVKRRNVEGLAFDEEGKAYPLVTDVVKGTPAKVSWERQNLLDHIHLGQYPDAECFTALAVKGSDFHINSKALNVLLVYGEFNLLECS